MPSQRRAYRLPSSAICTKRSYLPAARLLRCGCGSAPKYSRAAEAGIPPGVARRSHSAASAFLASNTGHMDPAPSDQNASSTEEPWRHRDGVPDPAPGRRGGPTIVLATPYDLPADSVLLESQCE